jgi:hypothetical protein
MLGGDSDITLCFLQFKEPILLQQELFFICLVKFALKWELQSTHTNQN